MCAYKAYKHNFRDWPQSMIDRLFLVANRGRMRLAGAPVPDQPDFRLYRGVAGRGRARRPRGWSWTSSLDVACWFAMRYGLANPGVVEADVANEEVLTFLPDRGEDEFLCRPEKALPLRLTRAEIEACSARYSEWKREEKRSKFARLLDANRVVTSDAT